MLSSNCLVISDSSNLDKTTTDINTAFGNIMNYGIQNLNRDVVILQIDNLWMKTELSGMPEYALYVNEVISLRSAELAAYISLAFILFGIICLVGLMLMINIIRSVVTRNKLTKTLYYDEVTNGKNWMYFKAMADKILSSRRINKKNCIAVLAIENAKYDRYCTCYGGDAGELMSEKMYLALKECLGKHEVFARHSEGLFGATILFQDEKGLQLRIHSIMESIEKQMKEIDKDSDEFGIHIGIYVVPEQGAVVGDDDEKWSAIVEHYFHHARIAAASIEDMDASEVRKFDELLLEMHLWEHKVEARMDKALKNEEFVVYLQPKYDPRNKELRGAEALVRWISPEDGFISPGKFIPIFESNGFIMKIDDYMIEHVAKLQAEWIAKGFKVVPVSVNVSRAHFAKDDLAEHICQIIDKYHIPHNVIELELTESAFFDDKAAILSTIGKMQNYGFQVSMDDFGSGYSSLNSLKDLPLNVLKLDAEFFRGESVDKRGEIIVEQAIELAKKLDMETVAEGVEKENQVDFLAKAGCDMIQGFYFDKPMPAEEYEMRMNRNERK